MAVNAALNAAANATLNAGLLQIAKHAMGSERADCRKLDWPIAAESFRPGRPRRAL